jgi:hypothetical protein
VGVEPWWPEVYPGRMPLSKVAGEVVLPAHLIVVEGAKVLAHLCMDASPGTSKRQQCESHSHVDSLNLLSHS